MSPVKILLPRLGFTPMPLACIAYWGIYMIRIDLRLPISIVQDYQERLQATVTRLTE